MRLNLDRYISKIRNAFDILDNDVSNTYFGDADFSDSRDMVTRATQMANSVYRGYGNDCSAISGYLAKVLYIYGCNFNVVVGFAYPSKFKNDPRLTKMNGSIPDMSNHCWVNNFSDNVEYHTFHNNYDIVKCREDAILSMNNGQLTCTIL